MLHQFNALPKNDKIVKVECKAFHIEPITNGTYLFQKERLLSLGHKVMEWNFKENFRKNPYIVYEYFFVDYILKSGLIIRYHYKPGWIFDCASVPFFLRWFIDDNDPRLLPGAAKHDSDWDANWTNEDYANKEFDQVNQTQGIDRFSRFWILKAVQAAAPFAYEKDEEHIKTVRTNWLNREIITSK